MIVVLGWRELALALVLSGCILSPGSHDGEDQQDASAPDAGDHGAWTLQDGAVVLLNADTGTLYEVGDKTRTGLANLTGASGLAVDEWGRILVADTQHDRVVRMDDIDGHGWKELKVLGHGSGSFVRPVGVAVDAAGHIYVLDQGHGRVVRIDDLSGTHAVSFGWSQEDETPGRQSDNVGTLRNPTSLALTSEHGPIYVADGAMSRIISVNDLRGNGWATQSRVAHAETLAGDVQGRVYVYDDASGKILRMDDITGKGETAIGRPDGPGTFGYVRALAVHPDGTLYVVDSGSHSLWAIPATGQTSRMELPGPHGSGAPAPWSVAVGKPSTASAAPEDSSVNAAAFSGDAVEVYITDYALGRIGRYDGHDGSGWQTFGTKGTGIGQFTTVNHIAIDSTGRIYAGDNGDKGPHRAEWFDGMTGANWTLLPSHGPKDPFDQPFCLRLDAQGRIYAAGLNAVARMDNVRGDGWVQLGGTIGTAAGQFSNPTDIAFDIKGRIYVTDKDNARIVRMDDMTGAGWTTYGKLGAGVGEFDTNIGLTVDDKDRILVADEHNHRVVRFDDMTGKGWVELSQTSAAGERLRLPHDVDVSPTGKIYVIDTGHARLVRVDDMNGNGWTTFGVRGAAWRTDNTANGLDELGVAKGVSLRPT